MSTFIYHFSHHSHLKSVSERGLVCKESISSQSYIDISSQSVQDNRSRTNVPITPPNGNLHNYVPFYFGPLSPTLFTISRNPDEHGGVAQRDLIYFLTTAERIASDGLDFVFTDGHGVMVMTDFYSDLNDLTSVDQAIVGERYWADTPEDPDRKRRKQAEFLVHQTCPWEQIVGIGVFDEEMKQYVDIKIANSTHKPQVAIRRNWYY